MDKVVIGLSGGVDSSVAAALLIQQGFDVCGVCLDIGGFDCEGAKVAAETLSIPLHIIDISRRLERYVKEPFVSAYLIGETPNPCVLCNPRVKFPALLEEADSLGAKFIATGHYAKVCYSNTDTMFQLLESAGGNDQSYMLCRLGQDILSRLILPLGGYAKNEVRSLAAKYVPETAQKPDSMDICFIPDGDYASYVERQGEAQKAGDFTDEEGRVLGQHRGIYRYTIGQRRGLNLAFGQRMYVKHIDAALNTVVLAKGDGILVNTVDVADLHWTSVTPRIEGFCAKVKVRHSKTKYDALILPSAECARIEFAESLRRPSPGQTAVFYDGGIVLGCGRIL